MQRGTDFRFSGDFESHEPEDRHPAALREECRGGNEPTKGFGVWMQTFRSCMSAAIRQARQSRIDGLTKRCYRE